MVDQTLVDFVKALRTAEVRVSPAETLDAMHAMDIVGYTDREFLKSSLSMVLSKNTEEKEAFDVCFDRFFTAEKFSDSDAGSDTFEDESQRDQDQGDFNPQNGSQPGEGQGGGGGGGQSSASAAEVDEDTGLEPLSELGKMLLSKDRNALTVAMIQAGREVQVREIVVFTQKGLFTRKIMDAMGLKELQAEISDLQEDGHRPQIALAKQLKRGRERLREQVRDYVEKQFLLHADEKGKQLREELLKKVKLSNMEKRNMKDVQEIVFRMAKKLVAVHSRRKKTYKKGALDVRKTLRHNMQYDGSFFDIRWKSSKVDRPKVMAICDVSGSVSNYSRFLLMF
ncbi:MAG: VWA domain-containing protein, partial [Gammaproteobacteria bacterium]|nr:VWA domain-containing protein [Gammaproteobacteria bacterium]